MARTIQVTLVVPEGEVTSTLKRLRNELEDFDPDFEVDGEPVAFSYGDHDEEDEGDTFIVEL